MHLQGCSISMSVCLLIVFFQVCDGLLASSWLISPFLSSGVLSVLIISRPCGGCDSILISPAALFTQRNIDVLNHTNCCSKSNQAAFLRKGLVSSVCHLSVFSILDLIDVLLGDDFDYNFI